MFIAATGRYNRRMVLSLAFAVLGFLVGVVINALADDLPARRRPQRPSCPGCDASLPVWRWLAVSRLVTGWACPTCGRQVRRRAWLVEIITALLFGVLAWFIREPITLSFSALYVAILVLIIVTDVEHRLILHAVTVPGIAVALTATALLPDQTWRLALAGAAAGFVIFFLLFWLGHFLFGPGALGFGDVTLATMMGAMLGFDRIFFALILGIVLGGIASLALLILRRRGARAYIPYGPFLAVAGILMLIWGRQLYLWYVG